MSNFKGIFISGTDTGVGKTVISSGMVCLARQRGLSAIGVKPFETGCIATDKGLVPEDGIKLVESADHTVTIEECVPFRFKMPASPYRAAKQEGAEILLEAALQHINRLSHKTDFMIIEGAGGLMVPLNGDFLIIDLIAKLEMPVLLVAAMKLGTINHCLLSLEALRSRKLPISGIVLSQTHESRGPEELFTAEDLSLFAHGIPIATLEYIPPHRQEPKAVASILQNTWPQSFISTLLGVKGEFSYGIERIKDNIP